MQAPLQDNGKTNNRSLDVGEYTHSAQAVEVKQVEGTLYCSGQVAIGANGQLSDADMRNQFLQTIQNVEQLISEAGYECEILSA